MRYGGRTLGVLIVEAAFLSTDPDIIAKKKLEIAKLDWMIAKARGLIVGERALMSLASTLKYLLRILYTKKCWTRMCWLGRKENAPGTDAIQWSMKRSEPIAEDGGAVSVGGGGL